MPRYLKFPESLPIPSRGDFSKTPEAHINPEKSGAFGYYSSELSGESQWVLGSLRPQIGMVGKTEMDLRFEVAGGRDFRSPRFHSRPKDLPKHMGHAFEDNLCCKWCGYNWNSHRIDPQECERSVGRRSIKSPAKVLEKINEDEQEK